jgi:hypothetical protein
MKIIYENDTERRNVPIYVTDRSHTTDIFTDTQIITWRRTWRNLSSIFLILHDFDYSPAFFTLAFSDLPKSALRPRPLEQDGVLAASQEMIWLSFMGLFHVATR